MVQITLDGEHLTLEEVMTVALAPSLGQEVKVTISEGGWGKVRRAQRAVETFIEKGEIEAVVFSGRIKLERQTGLLAREQRVFAGECYGFKFQVEMKALAVIRQASPALDVLELPF